MNLSRYPEETGQMTINGKKMEWTFRRSKAESAFGIRGTRIFALTLKKDGSVVGDYGMGWDKKIPSEDEESALCLTYLLDRFGKQKKKEKKNAW